MLDSIRTSTLNRDSNIQDLVTSGHSCNSLISFLADATDVLYEVFEILIILYSI